MIDFYRVLIQSASSFVVLVIISKFLGKKQVAQLELIDYVVGISIGSIAAQMAVDPEIPYYHFIAAMAVYGVLSLALTFVGRKSPFLKRTLKGGPLIIINKGEIDYKTLKKSKLDIDEVVSMCRIKGFFSLKEINYCIFEPNGDFSIMPKADNLPTIKKDLNIKEESGTVAVHLIVDGKINKKALKQLGEKPEWVVKKAKVQSKEQIKNIMLLSYFKDENKTEKFLKS